MDRFHDDPQDAEGSIIGGEGEGEIGDSIVDLRNVLSVDHVASAELDLPNTDELTFAVEFSGVLPDEARRRMLVALSAPAMADLIAQLTGLFLKAHLERREDAPRASDN